MNEKLNTAFEKIRKNGGKLEALNPVYVLQRGYSVAEKDGKIVSSVNDVKTDDILNITLKDGKIITKVQG